ncbi:MAG: hypothetical protein ABII71_03035 [Candidatus Micrarchaeota archaeon]
MVNTCTPMDQEDFENAAASLRFRFNPSNKFKERWDKAVRITEEGQVIIKDANLFDAIMRMPLWQLHGNAILVEKEDAEGTFRQLSSSRWVLTSLGLHPTVESDLLVDRRVDVAGVLLEIANDEEESERIDGTDYNYPGGVNPARVIYALKILEHVATHSTEVNLYGCDIKAGEEDTAYNESVVPARGHMAIHKLSQHLSPVSGDGKFQASSMFMHVVGLHVLKNIFLEMKALIKPELFEKRIEVFGQKPIVGKSELIINPWTELLHSMSGHNLLEALAHCTESNYGTERLAELLVFSLATELATVRDTEGPVQMILGTQAIPFGMTTLGSALPAKTGNGHALITQRMIEMYQGIYELFKLPPVLPYLGFSMLEDPQGLQVVGDSPPIIPVPNFHNDDIRRIAIRFLGNTNHKLAVGGLVLAVANLIAPFMHSDPAQVPPTIRKNVTTLFASLTEACAGCGLPGNMLGSALLYPDSLYGDDGELAAGLINPETFNAVAPLVVSAQVRAMGIREDLGISDGNGHSEQPLWKLTKDMLTIARRKTLNGGDNSEQARIGRFKAGLTSPCTEQMMAATGLKRDIHEVVLTMGGLAIKAQRTALKQQGPKQRAWLLSGRV